MIDHVNVEERLNDDYSFFMLQALSDYKLAEACLLQKDYSYAVTQLAAAIGKLAEAIQAIERIRDGN